MGTPLIGDGVAVARELRERGERQRANADAKIRHRLAIKDELGEVLGPTLQRESLPEAVIRDADRQPDRYPNPDDKFRFRRVSPWFNVGIMRSYSGGISTMLRLDRVFIEGNTARAQVEADKEDGELVRVVGQIPYDSIVAVDREGDSHYPGPHIYCHFDFGHEPYERVLLYREHSEGVWLPIENVKYQPRTTPLWRRLLWHRNSRKLQRKFEREQAEWVAEQEQGIERS
jgi:hypothetical protein